MTPPPIGFQTWEAWSQACSVNFDWVKEHHIHHQYRPTEPGNNDTLCFECCEWQHHHLHQPQPFDEKEIPVFDWDEDPDHNDPTEYRPLPPLPADEVAMSDILFAAHDCEVYRIASTGNRWDDCEVCWLSLK